MSRVHVRFQKEEENGELIVYKVDSSDFSKTQDWELIARVTIDRAKHSYAFEPLGGLLGHKVVPPFVYDLTEAERDRFLREEYENHAYGGWTSRIANVIRRMFATGEFPDQTYGIT